MINNTMSTMAKCGMYKYSFCTHKHDAVECKNCLLVKRHGKMYKIVDGQRVKKCPHCGGYKPLTEFRTNSNGNIAWCITCQNEYNKLYARRKKAEAQPIVRVTFISPDNTMHKQQELNAKEFKQFCKEFIESETFGTKVMITKL